MINKVAEFKDRFNQALSIRNVMPVDLSKKTKISESTISQYRSGYAKPKEEKLAIISNALNINPAWLMGLDVPMENPHVDFIVHSDKSDNDLIIEIEKRVSNKEQLDRLLRFIDLFLKLPPDKQKAIENLLE